MTPINEYIDAPVIIKLKKEEKVKKSKSQVIREVKQAIREVDRALNNWYYSDSNI